MTDTLSALREGRALIEKGWTREAFARTSIGTSINIVLKHENGHYYVPGAVAYCTTGAASVVTWDSPLHEEGSTYSGVIEALAGALEDLWAHEDENGEPIPVVEGERPWDPVGALIMWNDSPGRSKNEVLRLWDRAIQLVSAAEETT